ncbi:MAG: PAS domain-containing protein [Planctomycetes bacterium]|nr:PAS domain-containing protein [Planctomycetota bacterium]
MPRTPLAWHLFAGWCVLVAAVLAGCYWVASVQMAALAMESQRQRLVDLARGLAATSPDGKIDAAAFSGRARDLGSPAGVEAALLGPEGQPLDDRRAAEGLRNSPAVSEAICGRIGSGSRFDAATGRRSLTVAVPHGPPGRPSAVILLEAETTAADRALTGALRGLAAGCAACGVAAIGGGWLLARRAARPVEELCDAAARLAAGDVEATLPAPEVAELAGLSTAFGSLREQLVERGLTIGRQGTQQEAVLGSMIEGVLAIDARQRVMGLNAAAADLLGVVPAEVIRHPIQEVIQNPDLRRFALRAIDCREPVEDNLVLRSGRDRTIRLRGTTLRDQAGAGGAVIVLNDVTDMQRLENVRRDFVANVSHELKTPVASIKGFVETLLDGAVDDPVNGRRFLEIVGRQADRLAAIIEDLLSLSRIEQSEGAGNLPLEEAAIGDVFAAVAAECGRRATERSLRFDVACPEGLRADINPPLLEQAVINLVDNAINYSDPGGAVRLTAELQGPEIVIRVADEGVGIEAAHLSRLFERFYRVDKARSRKLGGTGLGLSIVKHIVQAHGGKIDVSSTPGQGSTFTIWLPAGDSTHDA